MIKGHVVKKELKPELVSGSTNLTLEINYTIYFYNLSNVLIKSVVEKSVGENNAFGRLNLTIYNLVSLQLSQNVSWAIDSLQIYK